MSTAHRGAHFGGPSFDPAPSASSEMDACPSPAADAAASGAPTPGPAAAFPGASAPEEERSSSPRPPLERSFSDPSVSQCPPTSSAADNFVAGEFLGMVQGRATPHGAEVKSACKGRGRRRRSHWRCWWHSSAVEREEFRLRVK